MTDDASRAVGDRSEIVLFNINDDYFVDMTLRLARRGARIRAIVSKMTDRFREALPDTELIESQRLWYPEGVLALNDDDTGCLSASDIDRFVEAERLFLHITDRLSYYPTTVRFRVQLYRSLLRYWIRFFEARREVGTVFYISAPHLGFDSVSYHVARHFGVRTLFVDRSLLTNRILLLEDYDAIDRVPPSFLEGESIEAVRARVDPELLQRLHEASPWSKYSAAINEDIVDDRRSARHAWAKKLTRGLPQKVVAAAEKLRQRTDQSPFFLQGGPLTGAQLEVERLAYGRHLKRMHAVYEGLCAAPAAEPYVFFALHLQPERSTCPQGGVYDDQALAVETAAKALPQGWSLYVKEHPRQFSPQFLKCKHFRDESFYRRLAALPNVRLMSIAEETGPLIRGARATATTTGSAGWESLLAGKPCLAFGTPWYGGCHSCHVIRSLDDCRAAYEACASSTAANVERDVLTFLAFMQDRFVHASNAALFADGQPDYDRLVDNLVDAVWQRARLGGAPASDPG